MKRKKSIKVCCWLLLMTFFFSTVVFGQGRFEPTTDGIRYIVRDDTGKVIQNVKPEFDPQTGQYYVKDEENRIVAQQYLPAEASMAQIKIVAPVKGDDHSIKTKDFLGNSIPVLRELPANDPRYQQFKSYIDSDPGIKRVIAMQLEARNMKLESLQNQLNQGVKDPQLVQWLANDLKKPVYLEVGDSGAIYHDPKGFVLAEKGANGQVVYRDNSYANRIVIPPNSEAFQGGMNDSSAASIIAHETGHMIMDQLYERNNYPKTNYAGPHSKNSITDEGFAISEGWAEAIETIANKDRLDSGSSWRLKSQQNIVDNKYIFKNQGVVDGPNDGILKNGIQMLSTEGVNASLFYRMLQDNHIQAPYSKVCQVFEQAKPQTYRDFIKSYIQIFPEDRSRVIGQFLENTKYATVDSTAVERYKALHDAEQAYLNAPADNPQLKATLEENYRQQKQSYEQWKEQVYQKAVVDGNIDSAIDGNAVNAYSDATGKEYRKIRLSETILKSQKALGAGLQKAAQSIKESFSIKNVAMTAGTAIAMNLATQIFRGEKVSFKNAFSAVASWQFVGNVVGSTFGAAAGLTIAPLIQTFVPIPVVGTIAGALLPTLGALAGGRFGGTLGAGMDFKTALRSLDWVAISGQAVGSFFGSMLGSMIPIPVVGTMIGSIVGGWLGEKIFTGIAKLFGYKKKADQPIAVPTGSGFSNYQGNGPVTFDVHSADVIQGTNEAEKFRLPASLDRVPIARMDSTLQNLKINYEKAYQDYVRAISSGDKRAIANAMNKFFAARFQYSRELEKFLKNNPRL